MGRQVGWAVLTLFLVSIITFAAINFQPGTDTARRVLGQEATQEQVVAFAEAHGLNGPVPARYVTWLTGFVRGDWGLSVATDRPVKGDIQPRFVRTLVLALLALLSGIPLGVGVGVFAALRLGSRVDLWLTTGTVILAAIPEFVIGIALLLVFAVQLRLVPVGSAAISFGSFWEAAQAYILPALTLVLAMLPHFARITRASVRDALSAQYVQAAVLRGLSRNRVIWNHVIRNAASPIITVIGLNAIFLLGGVIVVENVFGFPGIGQELIEAIGENDGPTVEAIVMVMGALFIGISLIADLLALYFNPRLRGAGQ